MTILTLAAILPMFVGIAFGAILSGIAGVKGLLDSFNGQRAADRANRAALTAQERNVQIAEEDRKARSKYLSGLTAMVEKLAAEGVWDPAAHVQRVRSMMDKRKVDDMQNAGAALASAGYKTGDTIKEKGLAEVSIANDQKLAELASQLQAELPMQELQVRTLLNPGAYQSPADFAANSEAAQGYRYDAMRRASNTPNLGNLANTMMPFLDLFGRKKQQTAEERITQDQDWINSL